MRRFTLILILCTVLNAPTLFAQGTTIINESFSAGLPTNFLVQAGSASVTGGVLTLTSGCIQLPGPTTGGTFSRAKGISIEADINIRNAGVGDFNVWGFYDTLPHCETGPRNGYYTGWFPAGSDSPNDVLDVITNNIGVSDTRTPATIIGNTWVHVKQEFFNDGTINTYINGTKTLTTNDNTYTTGLIAIRSWMAVDIDNLIVKTLSSTTGTHTLGPGGTTVNPQLSVSEPISIGTGNYYH